MILLFVCLESINTPLAKCKLSIFYEVFVADDACLSHTLLEDRFSRVVALLMLLNKTSLRGVCTLEGPRVHASPASLRCVP